MGEVALDSFHKQLVIYSHLIIYGDSADDSLTEQMRDEIETMWNEPSGGLILEGLKFEIEFRITAELKKNIEELEVLQNLDPRNNYFRIEEFAHGNISFVDGLGCNTGYFKLENLYKGSTTAAHEYGHTLGLHHPEDLDLRGKGVPGIMYPRGTFVDPQYQYDPSKLPGETGGTMHPMYRKVKTEDIEKLKLHKLSFSNAKAILGDFTNVYHWNHAETDYGDFISSPILG